MPYFAPGAVGRHVLTLDNPVGIPQYSPASREVRPLFYPLWTIVYSHPFSGSLIRPAAAVGYTVLGGSFFNFGDAILGALEPPWTTTSIPGPLLRN